MPLIVTNNTQVTLGLALASADTEMTVSSIVGLPDVSAVGDFTTLSLINTTSGAIEYVKCTDLDTLNRIYTIERAQEGTLALDFPIASEVKNFFTAGMFTELAESASTVMKTLAHTIDNTLITPSPVSVGGSVLILAKYGNQLVEGTDYEFINGADDIQFIGTQAIEGEEVTLVYSEGIIAVTKNVEALSTTEMVVTKVLEPDGNGGVHWVDGEFLTSRKIVRQASDFDNVDSTIEYIVDGVVDMGTTSIEVPVGGINIMGLGSGVTRLTSSEDNYTMFTSPVGGSGSVSDHDLTYEVTGTNSKVYALTDATGFNAVEHEGVNYENCTSLGYLEGYRQGLELNTGRFGGTPELEFIGNWLGGYRATTTLTRSLTDGAYCLFKAGTGLVFNSRFFTDMNVDLNATVGFTDFAPANFANANDLQLRDCEVLRNGVRDASDSTLIPNILATDLKSSFRGNLGLPNTHVGGDSEITATALTTINTIDVFEDLAGTYTTSSLTHFDAPANGQLRHLGDEPLDYKVTVSASILGTANEVLNLKLVKWDDSASQFVDIKTETSTVSNLQGGSDFAYFHMIKVVELSINDYIKLQVSNSTTTANVTAKVGTDMFVEER